MQQNKEAREKEAQASQGGSSTNTTTSMGVVSEPQTKPEDPRDGHISSEDSFPHKHVVGASPPPIPAPASTPEEHTKPSPTTSPKKPKPLPPLPTDAPVAKPLPPLPSEASNTVRMPSAQIDALNSPRHRTAPVSPRRDGTAVSKLQQLAMLEQHYDDQTLPNQVNVPTGSGGRLRLAPLGVPPRPLTLPP